MTDKPQLHQSMISMYYKCPEQFRRRYGARFDWNDREEIVPPGIALITGIATHKSIESNLNSKIDTGELLPLEQVKDIARDNVIGQFNQEVTITKEEGDPKKLKGECIDMTVTLSELHAIELAPVLLPVSVERKWVVELDNFPYDLSGMWDIEEEGDVIRDTKTSGKSPSTKDADASEQLTMYSLAKQVCDGKKPPYMYIDALVKLKTPKIVTLATSRTDAQHNILLRRVEIVTHAVEKGVFTPANPQDWWCSKKFCGYYNSCIYVGR